MLQVRIKKKLGNFLLDVDFSMDGGIFAILGASGCGKSMTLKCIAGIERPDEGRIVLNDRVLFDSAKRINLPPQKRKVGYMFQDYALFPAMNVVQNIQAGMGRKPDPKKAEPEVLLLDEPFAALDSYLKWKMEQQMLELLQKVQTPVLFVSHSRDEVYRLCDTVSCIHQGRMEVIEPVKEFFRNPKTKTAALLSGCKNICAVEAMESHRDGNWLWTSDWGVGIRVSKEALQARTIGIRAHFFTKEKPSEGCYSEFPVGEYRIMEDPFEWNVSFRKDRSCEWLQWKTAKTDWDPSEGVPEKLYVKEENLLLLDIDTDNRR